MPKMLLRTFVSAATLALSVGMASAQTSNVLQFHNDQAATGQNLQETALTPDTVKSSQFGALFQIAVDPEVLPNAQFHLSGSQIYAQPLYVAGVSVPGKGRHNLLFVATEHDSVYAYDGDTGDTLWKRTDFISGTARTTIPGNSDLQPEIGITSTPVIDAASGTMYVVVRTLEGAPTVPTNYHQRLHALDIRTGADKLAPGFPVEITAQVAGTEGRPVSGPIVFRSDLENQRCALVLDNGKIIIAWASHRDQGPYHGWVISYDAQTGKQLAVFNDSPSIRRYGSGIWQSGGAPSIDDHGNILLTTGNGDFNTALGDYGEAFLKLDPNTLAVADYFVPFNHDGLDAGDADVGTSGLTLLPDSTGSPAHPHLMITGGKVGMLYLLDRDNLGKFDAAKNNVVQEIEIPSDGDGNVSKRGNGLYSVPAYFNGSVYYVRTGEYPKRVPIANAHLDESQMVSNSAARYGFPGATPAITADGSANGIVWALDSYDPAGGNFADHSSPGHLRLHAYDALTLAELFNSGDTAPTVNGELYRNFMKFVPPTITNGHVYAASGGSILVYGLKTPTAPSDVTRNVRVTRGPFQLDRATGQYVQSVTLTNTGRAPISGPISLVLDNLTDGFALPLTAGTGTTSYSKPSGAFYRNLAELPSGRSASVSLTFTTPPGMAVGRPNITYRPRILAGPGVR